VISKRRARYLLDNLALGGEVKYAFAKPSRDGEAPVCEDGVTECEDAFLQKVMREAPAGKGASAQAALCDIAYDRVNCHGSYVGERGETGVHALGKEHRGSGVIPRAGGGVMVIVSSLLDAPGGDEVRFDTEGEAVAFLDGLKALRAPKNGIPF
jgi:hypothetical protein